MRYIFSSEFWKVCYRFLKKKSGIPTMEFFPGMFSEIPAIPLAIPDFFFQKYLQEFNWRFFQKFLQKYLLTISSKFFQGLFRIFWCKWSFRDSLSSFCRCSIDPAVNSEILLGILSVIQPRILPDITKKMKCANIYKIILKEL